MKIEKSLRAVGIFRFVFPIERFLQGLNFIYSNTINVRRTKVSNWVRRHTHTHTGWLPPILTFRMKEWEMKAPVKIHRAETFSHSIIPSLKTIRHCVLPVRRKVTLLHSVFNARCVRSRNANAIYFCLCLCLFFSCYFGQPRLKTW